MLYIHILAGGGDSKKVGAERQLAYNGWMVAV